MQNLFPIRTRISEIHYYFPNEEVYELSNRLSFAERIIYWSTAFRTFSEHPLLGVGPGNAGFFFESNLPSYGRNLTEIQNVMNVHEFGFPNPKNLWVRILAENGILGFASFATWLCLLLGTSVVLWRRGGGYSQIIGLAGLISIITYFVEGFSLDTYALPQHWILLGFITAASVWEREINIGKNRQSELLE